MSVPPPRPPQQQPPPRSDATAPCRCRPLHHGVLVDAAALNRAAEERLRARRPAGAPPSPAAEVDCLIVPGFTPRFGWSATHLHPLPAESCARAADDLARGVADVVIATGGAVHGPANEAVLLRDELIARGVPEDRVLVEPCARHTTTNLRNAARIMLAFGLREAYVVCPDARRGGLLGHYLVGPHWRQAYYVGYPLLSGFALRARLTLGYSPGRLAWERPWHVRFRPSPACLRESPWPSLEGDP